MTELQTFKMTGTIEEYITAYEGIHDRAPNTINFDEPGPHLDFFNGLPTHIRCQFDMTCCKNLEDVFLEGKHAAQKSDNLHVSNKRKETPAIKREPRPNKQNNQATSTHPQHRNCTAQANQASIKDTNKEGKAQGSA
ncbi:hypothetical protein DSO57_1039621 [Entomophthora muscae]|uniref:Uncharacterized protein n=1 Tax=Entomophthora muscae TaxID=34485 RepID=A0ACC2SX11_9FUNG|nr:hypothetical protein DSO57_1039621 [Entomophthora muscae]